MKRKIIVNPTSRLTVLNSDNIVVSKIYGGYLVRSKITGDCKVVKRKIQIDSAANKLIK